MKLGSLFDGIGGFPLVASWHGIETLWASEIDAACVSITRRHFPNMLHLGDITKINGALIPPVDIITFGSPCQDLSVAGKRAGLKHEDKGDDETTRSGLFMEAVRIIREMRTATNGVYPRIIVWENVPGAFSSNGGEDFRVVLEEICRTADAGIAIPRYADGWPNAGLIVGDGYSVGWRQLDAQYWGVPQRRKRIYLVADFGGNGAAEILFKPEGMRRHNSQGIAPWKRFAGAVEVGAGNAVVYSGESVTSVANAQNPQPGDPAPTLNTDSRKYVASNLVKTFQMQRSDSYERANVASTLAARDYKSATDLIAGLDCRNATENGDLCGTLQAKGGGGFSYSTTHPVRMANTVRRLTPTECARLQGYPDDWAAYGHDGKKISDAAQYRAYGNSLALPCADYVISGVADIMDTTYTSEGLREAAERERQ